MSEIDKPLADFTRQLIEEGRAITRAELHLRGASVTDRDATIEQLRQAHRLATQDAPYSAPELNEDAAVWAAAAIAWAAGTLIDRGTTDIQIPSRLQTSRPQAHSVEAHWSVDLVFRFAADLVRRSEKISPDDPFHQQLCELLADWPLSCVGTSIENSDKAIRVLTSDKCLCAVYVDRILLRRDSERARSPLLQPRFEQAIGNHSLLGLESP